MKIVFLDKMTVGDVPNLDKIRSLGELETYEITEKTETINRSKDADIIITNKVVIDNTIIDACPKLKLICIAATGMNNVDLDHAKSKKIQVKNVTDYSTSSVTQSTFAMIFYLINQSRYFDDYVKSGNYQESPIFTHLGKEYIEIKNKTFGIIGMGAIGQSVARIATAFGCKVVYYSTSGKNTKQSYPSLELKDLLQQADIISIHAPLNNLTKDLIKYEEMKLMKESAFLLNMGRGGIVNEADLARALNENRITGAGLDVMEKEPIDPANPLFNVIDKSKIFITPHIAWASKEARELLIEKVYDNIVEFLDEVP